MSPSKPSLRPYTAADEDAAVELWHRSWQQAYPAIDFSARLAWWRERWRNELVPVATIMLAERDAALVGFVTVDPKTRYLDQIVVAPEAWARMLRTLCLRKRGGFRPMASISRSTPTTRAPCGSMKSMAS